MFSIFPDCCRRMMVRRLAKLAGRLGSASQFWFGGGLEPPFSLLQPL
jgi:hypothetical protein